MIVIVLMIGTIGISYTGRMGFLGEQNHLSQELPDYSGCYFVSEDYILSRIPDFRSIRMNGEEICEEMGYSRCLASQLNTEVGYFSDEYCNRKLFSTNEFILEDCSYRPEF